jgi:hypothetical protein
MAKEISWEIREQAEELYIVDGKTFEEVAEITGVSVAQLKRWGSGFPDPDDPERKSSSWTDRKKEYRTAFANIRRDTVLLRKRLISKALKSLDPQDVYAISSLESTVAKVQQAAGADMAATGLKEKRIIKTPQDAVDALGDVVEGKINGMLTKPGTISLAGIKEMKQALELIDKMKTKYTPEAKGKEIATRGKRKRDRY